MRRLCIFVLAVMTTGLAAVGCAPQAMFFNVDVKDASSYNLDPQDRNVSVVALVDVQSNDKSAGNMDAVAGSKMVNKLDSTGIANVAVGVAAQYETGQGLDSASVMVYTVPKNEFRGFPSYFNKGVKGPDKDYIGQLMVKSSSPILIFVDNLKFFNYTERPTALGDGSPLGLTVELPYYVELNAYDAMADSLLFRKAVKDTVAIYMVNGAEEGRSISETLADKLPDIAEKIGERLGTELSTKWTTEEWMLINYSDNSTWNSAYLLARSFKWSEAIAKWMPLTEGTNPQKASFAAFNIAVACEMMDERSLAREWIDFALGKYKFQEAEDFKGYLNK